MVIPGNMVIIVFGVIRAVMTGAPIFGFLQGATRNWLLVTNILLMLGGPLVTLIFVPRGKKFDLILGDALARGKITPKLQAALETVRPPSSWPDTSSRSSPRTPARNRFKTPSPMSGSFTGLNRQKTPQSQRIQWTLLQ